MSTVTINASGDMPAYAVLRTRTKPAAWWEKVLAAVWCLVTFVQFPGNELVLYPSALIFLLLFVLHKDETVPVALRCWILLPVPILGALSFGWSPAPSEALRLGLMMILHFIIIVTIACRITRQDIVRGFFAAGVITLAIAASSIDQAYAGGIYGSKNFFANRMLIIVISGLAIALNPKELPLLRLFAIPVTVTAFVFNVMAESATSLIFGLFSIALLFSLWAFWQPMKRIRHLRSMFLIVLFAMGCIGAIVYLAIPNNPLVKEFLEAFGKDSTLTNRTLFWEAGNRIAQERPLFGLGFEGFWRPETGAAQTINELDFKPFGTRHSFHNSYIEMKVALGYVGMILLIAAVIWTYARSIYNWLQSQDMATSFFLTGATIVLLSTFTESTLMATFDTMILIFYLSAATGFGAKYHDGETTLVALRPL